ncbi:monothiol glutaredoxin Grx5 [Schizosaccharomyces cryophilus OY26]|uniref:Monothiol glutaredoxin-5, mitochondrial n=1 Tax=Schizosaccharomyces cryophilus (strain OY26 / ATCC MYA-4695 / CBS 11777 / NBRC 106824 / NRRL Y48691) TaxID=653667 RepID=S9VZR9_SCHCR|nr:monothiol glutaredoxin Grx5 [Schizosaccharomyces cryophilus OY26]EPY53188.1 monothiol glutaredoxin Grx5 [Schizosaccharomyces cryophilus OY26]
MAATLFNQNKHLKTVNMFRNSFKLFGNQIRNLSTQTRQALEQAVKEDPVVLFMKGTPNQPMCGFSLRSIQVLSLENVATDKLATYNVLSNEELRDGIKEFSDWPTIPQLYINGEFVGGCDILMSLHKSGELHKMLKEINALAPTKPEGDVAN